MLQALHPLAMAGVDQHSNWRSDPVGRLAATSGYLATITFGDRAAAERAAARVRRIHEHITGTDTITGRPYEASDPALLLWVHATLVESGIVAAGIVRHAAVAPTTPTATSRRWSPRRNSSACPPAWSPPAWSTWQATSPRPAPDCAARPRPPSRWPTCSIRPASTRTSRRSGPTSGTAWSPRSRPGPRTCTATRAAPLTPARQTEIRQALGVLDAVFLGEPGVLEARQRITLRMRAARQA